METPDSKIKHAEQILISDCQLQPAKYRARCIQWDRTDDNGNNVEADLPSEAEVALEDLQLLSNATQDEIKDAMSEYLTEKYGFCHNGFFFDKV